MPLISSFPGPCQDSRGSLMAEAGSEEAFGKGGLKNACPGDKKREIHGLAWRVSLLKTTTCEIS